MRTPPAGRVAGHGYWEPGRRRGGSPAGRRDVAALVLRVNDRMNAAAAADGGGGVLMLIRCDDD